MEYIVENSPCHLCASTTKTEKEDEVDNSLVVRGKPPQEHGVEFRRLIGYLSGILWCPWSLAEGSSSHSDAGMTPSAIGEFPHYYH